MKSNGGLIIFGIVGGLMLAISVVMSIHTLRFISMAATADGTIVELIAAHSSSFNNDPIRHNGGVNIRMGNNQTYLPKVSFIAEDNKEYNFISGNSLSASQMGEKVKVLYNPQNPNDARIGNFFGLWGSPLILAVFGGVFFALYLSVKIALSPKTISKWLQDNGQTIEADVQQIDFSGVRINRWSPYVIVAQWVQASTNSAYIFKSGSIMIDPQQYVKAGDKIKVIIDPQNPKKYFMDISFLPSVKN